MRRSLLILIAPACAAATSPVAPWTPAQLSCPVREAPKGLFAAVVRPALPDAPANAEPSDATVDQVTALATTCAVQTRIGKNRLDSYLELVTLQLTATGMAEELKARGLDPALVGSVMAVGPGRANPDYSSFGDPDAARLLGGLRASGVDTDALPKDIWQIVGGYISAASRVYRSSARAR